MKRAIDFIIALAGLILFSPLLAVLWLMVRIKLGNPAIFRQIRPGKHHKPFTMYKFRSMIDEYDIEGNLRPDIERLTKFGTLLRSTSLDELPELFNVLKGDMSLVGPRPLLMEYLPYYSPEQDRRHEVKPGITGWSQVNGRNAINWEDKFMYDIWYVDNQSVWVDIKILVMTVEKVLKRSGINAEAEATMPRFKGSSWSDK